MPAYMISHVTVTDKAKFDSYLANTQSVAAKYDARPVAVGAQPKMLNGESDGHQMVFVIEFETMVKIVPDIHRQPAIIKIPQVYVGNEIDSEVADHVRDIRHRHLACAVGLELLD